MVSSLPRAAMFFLEWNRLLLVCLFAFRYLGVACELAEESDCGWGVGRVLSEESWKWVSSPFLSLWPDGWFSFAVVKMQRGGWWNQRGHYGSQGVLWHGPGEDAAVPLREGSVRWNSQGKGRGGQDVRGLRHRASSSPVQWVLDLIYSHFLFYFNFYLMWFYFIFIFIFSSSENTAANFVSANGTRCNCPFERCHQWSPQIHHGESLALYSGRVRKRHPRIPVHQQSVLNKKQETKKMGGKRCLH